MNEVTARLESDCTVQDGAVVLRYRLHNAGAGRLVLFDRLSYRDEAGKRVPDREFAYVTFAPEGGVVVDKLVPAIPDEIDVMSPEMPYGRVVKPGESLEGRALLRLPLRERTAYGLRGTAPLAETVWAVLRLGVAALPDRWSGEAMVKDVTLPWGEAAVLARHAWASQVQQVLVGARHGLQVPVLQP